MIEFKYIRWKNFLSYGNQFTEIQIIPKQVTLISGLNGSGKSTFLDALCFGLFGKPFRNINKPQLVNSIIDRNLVVEIEFDIQNNKYKIIRGIKPTVFEIYCNSKLVDQPASVKDYQDYFEKTILKVNYKSFIQVVILGSASSIPFMALTQQHRREIVEDLLDLQIFTVMNLLLKQKISDNELSLNEMEYKHKVHDKQIEFIKNHTETFVKDKQNQILEIESKIELIKEVLVEKNNIVKQLEQEISNKSQLEKSCNDRENIKSKLISKIKMLEKEIKFFHSNNECPTCKQIIDLHFKNESLSKKRELLLEYNDAIENLDKSISNYNAQLSYIYNIQKDILKENRIIENNEYEIKSYLHHIKSINDEISKIIGHDNLGDLENELREFEKEIYKHKKIGITYRYINMMIKDSGIKSRIIKQYIPIINQLINKYLSMMEFMVSFELNETFNEIIKSRFRDVFSYNSFSEGEKKKIDLALLFTFREISRLRNSVSTNLLVFDEVLDSSLDTDALDYFLDIIHKLSYNTIYVISHRENVSEKFDNHIRVEKISNFSKFL